MDWQARLAYVVIGFWIGVACMEWRPFEVFGIGSDATVTTTVQPPVSARETEWSAYLAGEVAGGAEYKLPCGSRVDIVTDSTAWEVEWCDKWPEAIGQALFYGVSTDLQPGIWLLKKPGHSDEDYVQCLSVIAYLRGRGIDVALRVEQLME